MEFSCDFVLWVPHKPSLPETYLQSSTPETIIPSTINKYKGGMIEFCVYLEHSVLFVTIHWSIRMTIVIISRGN